MAPTIDQWAQTAFHSAR